MTDRDLTRLAAWVVTTCLMFGTSVSTAYRVAAILVEVLEE